MVCSDFSLLQPQGDEEVIARPDFYGSLLDDSLLCRAELFPNAQG
jgi:hypothetical protein